MVNWSVKLDIRYGHRKENVVANAFICVSYAVLNSETLFSLHSVLCFPDIIRLDHFVHSRNLQYLLENIKHVCNNCHICQEIKPRYYKPETARLIKATQPFERLSIDVKEPIHSSKYEDMLTVIDRYSRFPFAFPLKDTTSATIKKCFSNLFSVFGIPSYVHSNRGTSLISKKMKKWLFLKGIGMSKTTPYNPTGNGQVEWYKGIIWKSVLWTLKSRYLLIEPWECSSRCSTFNSISTVHVY